MNAEQIPRRCLVLLSALCLFFRGAAAAPETSAPRSVPERPRVTVEIRSPADNAVISTTELSVQVLVRTPAGEPLLGLRALIDGRVAAQLRGAYLIDEPPPGSSPSEAFHLLTVPVPPRDCTLAVLAETASGRSAPALARLRFRSQAGQSSKTAEQLAAAQPALYALAVGVSEYGQADLRLRFAAKDAQDFAAVFKTQQKALYRAVELRVLTDKQATKDNILDGLEWLQRQTTAKDVAILFMAGHGITDPSTGVYYYLPHDADLQRMKRTLLPETDVRTTLANIPGKVLLFLDTCHAGKIYGEGLQRQVSDASALIGELASADNGVVVFAASTGRQSSRESPEWSNGAFTRALLEGLRGRADFQRTGRVTLNMLDLYISERVKELTGGTQTPTTAKPTTVPDFPLAVVKEISNDDIELAR